MKDALPFGIGGGLVAIKTLLSRDPCVHANTAIEMIDAILSAPAQPAPVQEPVASDGWLQEGSLLYRLTDGRKPQNRDEINVTMADGSRSVESCTRRAGELLDRIRATPPAAPKVVDCHATGVCVQSGLRAEVPAPELKDLLCSKKI
jgi:hypothetical protein